MKDFFIVCAVSVNFITINLYMLAEKKIIMVYSESYQNRKVIRSNPNSMFAWDFVHKDVKRPR